MWAAAAIGIQAEADGALRSELLLDLVIETETPHTVSAERLVVPVSGGTFTGPKLSGTVIAPAADWITRRADGSSVLDVRLMLRTSDDQKIFMSWRGIAYTPSGGALVARIVPTFETGASKYAWLNNVVAVGVYRPMPGKVAYRVHQIL